MPGELRLSPDANWEKNIPGGWADKLEEEERGFVSLVTGCPLVEIKEGWEEELAKEDATVVVGAPYAIHQTEEDRKAFNKESKRHRKKGSVYTFVRPYASYNEARPLIDDGWVQVQGTVLAYGLKWAIHSWWKYRVPSSTQYPFFSTVEISNLIYSKVIVDTPEKFKIAKELVCQ